MKWKIWIVPQAARV